jgi:hypothetical protein
VRLGWAGLVAMMMVLSGCGHQVTGLNQAGGGNTVVAPGETLIRFETAAPPDFGSFQYFIVINALGDGVVPIASGTNTNFREWSYAFLVNGGPGFANTPTVQQFYLDPSQGSGVNKRPIPPVTGTLFFSLLSSNGSVNGFDIRFNRCILDFPSPINTTGAPTPPPSPHPAGESCPPYFYIASTTWTLNIFTLDSTSTAIDSLGNGPSDTSYRGFTFDTAQLVQDLAYHKPAGVTIPQSQSAQITGIEVFSQPGIGAPTPLPSATPTASPTATPTPAH